MNMFAPIKDDDHEQLLKETEHLREFGYAPGDYMVRCYEEGCATTDGISNPQRFGTFIGDKRAIRCRSCAEKRYQEREDQRRRQLADNLREEARDQDRKHVRAPQLTRDDLIARHDDEECRKVDKALTVGLLVAKLHSEAEEIARDLTNAEEYGDLLTTLMALASLNGVSAEEINQAAREKVERKGHLKEGNFWIPREFMNG